MRIGIIGAGSMGQILARHLARLGHQISIANSRGPESLTALAAEIGATPVSVVDAAQAGEIVVIAIPTKAVADLPRALFANAPGSVIVIDIGHYHPELRDGRIDAIDRGMLDSQWVAQQIGRRRPDVVDLRRSRRQQRSDEDDVRPLVGDELVS